jgi:ribosomal subunit interface protein
MPGWATAPGDRDWGLPMQVTVKGKNTAVPEKVRARAEHKLAKLERFDDRILAMEVEFTEERNPRVADPHRVEVTLTTKSGLVRAHANATDPAAAVDQVVDRLERQVKKLKGRRVDRTQHAEGVKAIPPLPPPEGSGEPQGAAPVDQDREELDETDQGKVMYRRGDGDASADEPEP